MLVFDFFLLVSGVEWAWVVVVFVFPVVVVVSLVSVLLVNLYIVFFFSPSLSESPLSLLFKLHDVSISC